MAFSNDQGVAYLQFSNGGAITANSMVTLDTTEGRVVACTAITDQPIGVCVDTGSSTAGEPSRVARRSARCCRPSICATGW